MTRLVSDRFLDALLPDERAQYDRLETSIHILRKRIYALQQKKKIIYFRGKNRLEYAKFKARKNGL